MVDVEYAGPASSAGAAVKVGPEAVVGEAVYAGGGSFDGTVKAFIPGRSGRLVAGEGFASGFGLGVLLRIAAALLGASSAGPRKPGAAG